jgi:hypothetical protein
LTDEERDRLQSLAHRARTQPLLARRARVVLACGEGLDNKTVDPQKSALLYLSGSNREQTFSGTLPRILQSTRKQCVNERFALWVLKKSVCFLRLRG